MQFTFFKGVVLGALVSATVVGASAALAGTGVGGVFNLGQANSVNASTSLSGNTHSGSGAMLRVDNESALGGGSSNYLAAGAAVLATVEPVAPSASVAPSAFRGVVTPGGTTGGVGVTGKGDGVTDTGVWGQSAAGTGVVAASDSGDGLFVRSGSGTPIDIFGPDSSAVKLNGKAFPSATQGTKSISSWTGTSSHTVGQLTNLHAGSYLVSAKLTAVAGGAGSFTCTLTAGTDNDTQIASTATGSLMPMALMLTHQFAAAGTVSLACNASAASSHVLNVKIVATRLSGVSTAALP